MKITVIANPISGGGKGEKILQAYSRIMSERGHEIISKATRQAGDAQLFAGEIAADTDLVAVIGGDGTMSEVLNGLVKVDVFPLLSIAAGTANMLSRELGITGSIDRLADISEKLQTVSADLGSAKYTATDGSRQAKRFLLVASAGFDAFVTRVVKERRTGALGFCGYIVPLLRSLRDYTFPELKVSWSEKENEDNAEHQTGTGRMAVISNTRNYGGLFSLTDKAEVSSGIFDLCLLRRSGALSLLWYMIRAFIHRLGRSRGAVFHSAKCFSIRGATEELPVQLDGDYMGTTPLEVKMLEAKVPLVCGWI